jgi:hypothetical protein
MQPCALAASGPRTSVIHAARESLATISYQNKRELYGILFRAAAKTLRTIAADPKHLGAEIGFFTVLHTWGSKPASDQYTLVAARHSLRVRSFLPQRPVSRELRPRHLNAMQLGGI